MSTTFEVPGYEDLLAEQEMVQAAKFQGRMLRTYNQYIFPGQEYRIPLSSAVTDLARPLCDGDHVSLEGALEGLHKQQGAEQPIQWVDMGGGRGLAMRQAVLLPSLQDKLETTNVDLFNYGFDGLSEDEMAYLKEVEPDITEASASPQVLLDNAETVTLPKPADLITSVEGMQYLNNPLGALSNWYNQLNDNGLLIVAADHDWSSWIRYERDPADPNYKETPTKHLLQELGAAGINYAATDEPDWESGRPALNSSDFRILAIQKKAGTAMMLNTDVEKVWINPDKYKAAYYASPEITGNTTIEIAVT
jgi:SAM-dependent methyltransferase